MNAVTTLWSAVAGGALTMAGAHAALWLMDRSARANLAFGIVALAVAGIAITELGMMHAASAADYARWVRWFHLPNAVAIRFTESADLLSLHHKLVSRLCYNAQEEIFAASLDEAQQIALVDPLIGAHLGAPCLLRMRAATTPFCPEGDRYCASQPPSTGSAMPRICAAASEHRKATAAPI